MIKVLKNKEKIMSRWSSNDTAAKKKRQNNEKFNEVNHLLMEVA